MTKYLENIYKYLLSVSNIILEYFPKLSKQEVMEFVVKIEKDEISNELNSATKELYYAFKYPKMKNYLYQNQLSWAQLKYVAPLKAVAINKYKIW